MSGNTGYEMVTVRAPIANTTSPEIDPRSHDFMQLPRSGIQEFYLDTHAEYLSGSSQHLQGRRLILGVE